MRRLVFLPAAALALTFASGALATGRPDGAALVRLLGKNAGLALSHTGSPDAVSGLVRLPFGVSAESIGLEPVVPGFARVRGGASAILAFSSAHPQFAVEVAPPLHTLLNQAGTWTNATLAHQDGSNGDGVLVGVADTGLDVTHPDFLASGGATRVAWILDLSAKPYGLYPDLESKYGVLDASGNVTQGAVYQGSDFAALKAAGIALPGDEVGHGTHVTSIAAGNGGQPPNTPTPYIGIAPHATILFARITTDDTDSIDNDNLVRGVQFLFDRADFMQKPIAVNLSLGSDFGPHDGTMAWEETLASYVGPSMPGHALVAAAGNSGDITSSPVHESVRVNPGSTMRVPIQTQGSQGGALEVWIAMRPGATISVGLDGPDGQWISPVADGSELGKNTSAYNAGVINGSAASQSPIPTDSSGAVAVVSGTWPAGTYTITLEGEGTADLYLEGTQDVAIAPGAAGFLAPVREGTINLPATNPGIIGVGCTINRLQWTSIDEATESQAEPQLDPAGGQPVLDSSGAVVSRTIAAGEVCWFSSAGPTLLGAPKPEISAPGGLVVGALSSEALPGTANSIFTTTCPSKNGQAGGARCLQVDTYDAISQGTSMAAPMVAGAIALLFERDPTLTQDKLVGLLQAGAHEFRGPHPFDDQSGPGELDVLGALDALEQTWNPAETLPDAGSSWITLSADYLAADGSTPLTAILELRTAQSAHRADLFDVTRLQPVVEIDGVAQPLPTLVRRAPGVWLFTVEPSAGLGGSAIKLGATFDGEPIVVPKTIPIAIDIWSGEYATTATGGCAIAPRSSGPSQSPGLWPFVVACALLARRRDARV
jgi:subtilisin family serine protease